MHTFLQLITTSGFANLTLGNLVMFVVAGTLIYLAITWVSSQMLRYADTRANRGQGA